MTAQPAVFRRAERRRAKLRLALAGPSGSGKTYSALQIAFGLGQRITLIDTERGSGELYAHLGAYDVCAIEPPFLPQKYVDAISAAEQAGYDVITVDSLSHAWVGDGGMLDIQGRAAACTGNSWSAWREVTPMHNQLVDKLLQSPCHVVVTLRSKTEYVQTQESGKTIIRKVGLAPVFRDGVEYEFTVFFDLVADHTALASKDRTGLFDGRYLIPTSDTGRELLAWLDNSAEDPLFSPPSDNASGAQKVTKSRHSPQPATWKEKFLASCAAQGLTPEEDVKAWALSLDGASPDASFDSIPEEKFCHLTVAGVTKKSEAARASFNRWRDHRETSQKGA
ncbi:MAG: ATP-binding protein [Clostridia bacterium]|nr:ATP-binding protein [Clostridia bacterium]